jgi:hypothetical protein
MDSSGVPPKFLWYPYTLSQQHYVVPLKFSGGTTPLGVPHHRVVPLDNPLTEPGLFTTL